jgi:scyllo-inositol 2-dehydrogenase (NADP+)
MKTIVIGIGVQGRKRKSIAGPDLAGTVDPVNSEADYKRVEQVPLSKYECAIVCTPDAVKSEVLSYLLSNGKHVLVEKPLLFDKSDELRRLAALAQQNGVACHTAYNHRFEPHIARMKQLLDVGDLGRVYRASFFYGNGTARDVRNSTWRDKGMGVLSDLGSHMLDMALFLFGSSGLKFKLWSSNCFENRAPDHVIFGAKSDSLLVMMEGTLLSWRNAFHLDLLAEKGSIHIDCLCKWGASTLAVRKRIFPSGRPTEERFILEQPDPTWALEYEHFKKLCNNPACNLERDIWINDILNGLFIETKESA